MPNAPAQSPHPAHLRGVNLGGWLLLEKWMTPSLFAGLEATDETTWCAELGHQAPARLRAHWESFITREDFAWLAGVGVNAVRIPVGHWIFGPPYPYHAKYGANPHPFVEGGLDVLDRAFQWATEFGPITTRSSPPSTSTWTPTTAWKSLLSGEQPRRSDRSPMS